MWHAILVFLAGLIPPAPAEHCPYHHMWAYGDNVARAVAVAAMAPDTPRSLAIASGRLAQLSMSGTSNG
jgi:hypothetical protein